MQSKPPLKVLLTWELGGNLGHIARLLPVAETLHKRGHKVTIAAGKLKNIDLLPPSLEVVAAPAVPRNGLEDKIREPATFADILYNTGITQRGVLAEFVGAWRGIFKRVKPNVVVQDYSPPALLALQGYETRSMLLGTGFACPPNESPLPDIRAWQDHYPDRLQLTEQQVLETLNRQLVKQDQPVLTCVGELFTRVDANCLTTFPELDHYPARADNQEDASSYVGVWSDLDGNDPQWPEGEGQRIFAYLKPFKALATLLDHLGKSGCPCLVYINADNDMRFEQYDNLRIVRSPLDMKKVVRECDVSVLHAGHGSTATVLMAGKPILQLPFNVEQYHTAKNTERLGAGVVAMIDKPEEITAGFDRVISDEGMREAAARFASRYQDFDDKAALNSVIDKIEALARLGAGASRV